MLPGFQHPKFEVPQWKAMFEKKAEKKARCNSSLVPHLQLSSVVRAIKQENK